MEQENLTNTTVTWAKIPSILKLLDGIRDEKLVKKEEQENEHLKDHSSSMNDFGPMQSVKDNSAELADDCSSLTLEQKAKSPFILYAEVSPFADNHASKNMNPRVPEEVPGVFLIPSRKGRGMQRLSTGDCESNETGVSGSEADTEMVTNRRKRTTVKHLLG